MTVMLTKVLLLCIGTVIAAAGIQVKSACESNPCLDGYYCVPHTSGDFTCRCGPDVKNCQHPLGKRQNNCGVLGCPNSQVCVLETVYCKKDPCPKVATCVDKTADVCHYHPCQNGGSCIKDSQDGYKCTCFMGFLGRNCQYLIV